MALSYLETLSAHCIHPLPRVTTANPGLVDFGLARFRLTTQRLGTRTSLAGTMRWTAPELMGGGGGSDEDEESEDEVEEDVEDRHFTEKSEVYSFGIILYEILSRRLPFDGWADGKVINYVLYRRKRPNCKHIEEGSPRVLVDMMTAAWSHEPRERPTFKDMLMGLQRASFDIFISYRQRDTQDFAAHLYDLLTQSMGYRVFLDRRTADKLHELDTAVSNSRCVLLLLSDGIFDSKYCLFEVKSAIDAGIPVIPVIFAGSTWNGASFPDLTADYIPNQVTVLHSTFDPRPSLRTALQHLAVHHSRIYFDAFFEQLVAAIQRCGVVNASPRTGSMVAMESHPHSPRADHANELA